MISTVDYSIYLVIDDSFCPPTKMVDLVSQLVGCGVTCIQLRMKKSPIAAVETTARALLTCLKTKKIPLIINDHIEIAAAINADGVHIGQRDIPYARAREYLGYTKLIGVSIENLEQAQRVSGCDADYFGVGPIFNTVTKQDAASPIGIQQLHQITCLLKRSVVAIGGINKINIKSVLNTGVAGVAFISAILAARQPESATRELATIISLCQEENAKN